MTARTDARRIRVTLGYDGTDHHGWQVQPGLDTIQGRLEAVLAEIEESPVTVHGSGRTDAGVHAEAQVAAFTLSNPIPVENLKRAMNRLLPPSIRVLEAAETHAGFHPRFDALSKTYEYRLFRGEVCPPALWRFVHHHPYPLELEGMKKAARCYVGEHDFSAFAAADDRDTPDRSKVRRIFDASLELAGEELRFRVRGSGFLKHMVRHLTGGLIEAGRGNLDAAAIARFLEPGCARKVAASAPAKGLHLICVEYAGGAFL